MKHSIQLLLLAMACGPGSLLQAQQAPDNSLWKGLFKPAQTDTTSLKIIDLHLKSRGGKEALKDVGPVKFRGKLFEGQKEYNIESIHTPEGQARFEIFHDIRGYEHRTVKASDGTLCWQRKVLPEKQLPNGISGQERGLLDFESRLPFLFISQQSGGDVFAYIGKEEFLGRNAYVLHGWLETGLELDILLDEKSFRIINYRHPYKIGGRKVLVNLTPSKLKRQDGVWWEMEYKMHHKAKTFRRVSYDKMKSNIDTDETLFEFPEVKEFWLRSTRN